MESPELEGIHRDHQSNCWPCTATPTIPVPVFQMLLENVTIPWGSVPCPTTPFPQYPPSTFPGTAPAIPWILSLVTERKNWHLPFHSSWTNQSWEKQDLLPPWSCMEAAHPEDVQECGYPPRSTRGNSPEPIISVINFQKR